MTVFRIRALRKAYGARTVLDVDELDIESGERYALVGPNGAGKTTLLEILGFLTSPTAGKVVYNDRPVNYSGPRLHDLRREVGLVHQNPVLFTTTVYKNLEFGLKIRGIPKNERDRVIAASLDLVGMGGFVDAGAHRLSGGETQRVAIARALALNPQVLLCDEPTAGVDAENQKIIIEALRQVNERKKITIVFTTHDHFQVASLARHVLYLNRGRLVRDGSDRLPAYPPHN